MSETPASNADAGGSEVVARLLELAQAARARPDDVSVLSDAELAKAMSALVRLYAARVEALERFAPPIDPGQVSPTEALVTISEMIRTIDVNIFDLSMRHERQAR